MNEILNIEQRSWEWRMARLGIVTASEASKVIAKGRGGAESAVRRDYMHRLAAERVTGEPVETYCNALMQRHADLEPEARAYYEFMTDNVVLPGGFACNDLAGASPDGLVDDDGLIEIKVKEPHLQVGILAKNRVPPEYLPQIQCQLWVTGRAWCDFVAYCSPKLDVLIKRVKRDDEYIANMEDAVRQFNAELDSLTEWLREKRSR